MKEISLLILGILLISLVSAGNLPQNATVNIIPPAGTEQVGIDVDVPEPADECEAPEIFVDHTARGWFPNDQTIYTADVYKESKDNGGKYNLGNEYTRYLVSERMNYVFQGETVDYYILVRDENGKKDIDSVQLLVNDVAVGACAQVDYTIDAAAFGTTKKGAKDKTYVCKLIVGADHGNLPVAVKVTDGADTSCDPQVVKRGVDQLFFNPSLAVTLTGGPINFGAVEPGTVATADPVRLKNNAEAESGVVMDMYIASSDYFKDVSSTAPDALCPTGNGIKYDQFSYYATKGSLNSGANNNNFPALGASGSGICKANCDEFTTLPSHSGEIGDMCRIINNNEGDSLLAQGSEMCITFRLNVPDPCYGKFTDGKFHFVGRVV